MLTQSWRFKLTSVLFAPNPVERYHLGRRHRLSAFSDID